MIVFVPSVRKKCEYAKDVVVGWIMDTVQKGRQRTRTLDDGGYFRMESDQ